ncbi:helix-turn-helix domain-containing protein [Hyphomonas beringensis]|nr:XRE family transcriptional regulator [Hyphomonas beringensis]
MSVRKEKILIGPRLRRLRRTLGITQAQMGEDLGVSASYINLIEGNQRPISANLLVTLAQVYDFDMTDVGGAGDARLVSELLEALRDPALEAGPVGKNDAEDIVNANPDIARAFLRLYTNHRELSMRLYSDANPLADREKVEVLEQSDRSVDSVREFFHVHRNYFPELEAEAEKLSSELFLSTDEPHTTLTDRLKTKHNYQVRIVPTHVMPNQLRYFDRHHRRIDLSELLRQSGRRFQLAVQVALLEYAPLFREHVDRAGLPDRSAEELAYLSLANYFAAALLMPYSRFLKECEATKYDVELLSHRFGASFEQVAHRMTTLQKPDARGIPFFFVRMDSAGNVSKRFSAGRFHFSKFGGACPLWNIHDCFATPGQVRTQIIEMPDNTTYFSIARTMSRAEGAYDQHQTKYAIGLGCDIAYAPRLIYAQNLNLEAMTPEKIGVNCYMCERENCPSRAHAPLNKKLIFDTRSRGVSVFRFETD